jgi:uncharacterized protein
MVRVATILLAGWLAGALTLQPHAQAAEAKPGYRVGEQLPQAERSNADSARYKEIRWDALMPPDWDPMRAMKGLDFSKLDDSDPRAMEALERLRQEWSKAPVNPAMQGARIRIPGFVVPLEGERGKLREFLLVPFFGACIHVPPPPANQVIHVVSVKPLPFQSMDTVWVQGTIETFHAPTPMGDAAYRMKADAVSVFQSPPGR